jgi:uncharacterized protein (DUF1501 family)
MRREFVLTRRSFLIGCSAAASPLLTPVSFAAAPGENRLAVIVLRGGLDGLDLVRPIGDPAYAALRPRLARDAAAAPIGLDGRFALHPGAAALLPLWQAGELGFAHAVATPFRNRSHFIGQDALESGGDAPDGTLAPGRDGWLNRAVGRIRGAGPDIAATVGREPMLVLHGDAPVRHWAPVADSRLSAQGTALLSRLYAADPLLGPVFEDAVQLRAAEDVELAGALAPDGGLGGYVAARLRDDARIAAFSVGGWDTHQNQDHVMDRRLSDLSATLLALRDGLGPAWDATLVMGLTEFGRTARENGTGGTDHGTGGAMLMAGGAIKGGRVHADWPGLSGSALYDRRDLMPTADVRAYAASAMQGLFGLDRRLLETAVFPGLDMGSVPRLIL